MAVTINDNITLGGYVFTYNPASYSVTPNKIASARRTISGKLRQTGADDGSGAFVVKRSFSIGGVSYDLDAPQFEEIEAEFLLADDLPFIDPLGKTYTVRFLGFSYDQDESDPFRPRYSLDLEEV